MTSTDRWLDQLSQMVESITDDSDRGQFVLRVHSAIINLKSDNIVDLIRLLISDDVWRSFTYPNGDHYEFLPCEFDYFLAHNQIDPTLVRTAVRTTGSGDLEALLAESSMDKIGPNRRSVEDIVEVYPKLTQWLNRYGISRTLARSSVYADPAIREDLRNGGDSSDPKKKYRGRVRFKIDVTGDTLDAVAEKIANRLLRNPALAKKVYGKINYALFQTSR